MQAYSFKAEMLAFRLIK